MTSELDSEIGMITTTRLVLWGWPAHMVLKQALGKSQRRVLTLEKWISRWWNSIVKSGIKSYKFKKCGLLKSYSLNSLNNYTSNFGILARACAKFYNDV